MKHSLTKYVVFSITILLLYTIAEFVFSTITGVSHPDLSTLIGSTFGGEILFCALIKIFKLKSPQMPEVPEVMSEEELNDVLKELYKEGEKNADG